MSPQSSAHGHSGLIFSDMVVMSANMKFNYLFIILNSTATADTISPVIQYSSSLMHLVCDPILGCLVPERLVAMDCSEG